MKQLIAVLSVALIISGCGVADVTSGAGELADTGDRLANAIEEANQTVSQQAKSYQRD